MTDRIATTARRPKRCFAQAGEEGRGRLKIFLGAAPGVGKTYEMLMQGRQRRLDGVDAVIGVVETHGRVETDLLTKSFENIPKRRLPYKGHVLAEMDLDAILQRKPKLVLVDELAHTNAPGSRHPKRYMDVEEILADGIDVYTTLERPASRKPERCRGADHAACACARPCRIPFSTVPTMSSWSTSRRKT